ncbi:hypothetical protein GOARA_011_00270 [Gordonia araii NBRC 100433]|uniref:Uncharacterized protein n=1 Tax=Gordonia araii NBRC 100433 TaxID=1073574 RepID=G7GXT6_9ACTN|nr:hypothetical protein [Gordonia araii]NNG98393.1 hypothetical protein [Gordonia araii NBRC 100433]GAB08411.1 hypothetical protein GOARA_011_00270 [Gordonia araii NBRC 100433]
MQGGPVSGDFVLDPSAITAATAEVSECASRLMALSVDGASTFDLAGKFTGATADMGGAGEVANQKIQTTLSNASGTVAAFSEAVDGAKNTTEQTDQRSSDQFKALTPYPAYQSE